MKKCYEKYRNSEEGKTALAKYQGSEKCKKKKRQYMQSPAGKVAVAKYWASEKGKIQKKLGVERYRHKRREYGMTEKGKLAMAKYAKSDKGRVRGSNGRYKRKTILLQTVCDFTTKQWTKIQKKQGNKCILCGKTELTVDHIIPISKGGQHTVNNIQGLCRSCNARKGNRIDVLIFSKPFSANVELVSLL